MLGLRWERKAQKGGSRMKNNMVLVLRKKPRILKGGKMGQESHPALQKTEM